jgi:hypothetical protein
MNFDIVDELDYRVTGPFADYNSAHATKQTFERERGYDRIRVVADWETVRAYERR